MKDRTSYHFERPDDQKPSQKGSEGQPYRDSTDYVNQAGRFVTSGIFVIGAGLKTVETLTTGGSKGEVTAFGLIAATGVFQAGMSVREIYRLRKEEKKENR